MASAAKKQLLADARRKYKILLEADERQYAREVAALRFAAREQWPTQAALTRAGTPPGGAPVNATAMPARPTLVIDKTGPIITKLTNEFQAAEIGVSLVQAGDFQALQPQGENTELILREGLIRRIQRTSEAADARLWAYQRAVTCGRGYYGLSTQFVDGKTFDQDVVYRRFKHQGAVGLDPAHEEPDGSDAQWGFVTSVLSWEEYKATYPKRNGKANAVCSYSLSDFQRMAELQKDWFLMDDGRPAAVQVVEFFYTEFQSRLLYLLPDGTEVWADEAPEGVEPVDERQVLDRHVKWCKFDGCDDDVLEETDWVTKHIPIIKVLGRELQPFDGETRCEGIVQPLVDVCRANNYAISSLIEKIGTMPTAQLLVAEGQIEQFESFWNNLNTRVLPYLPYRRYDDQGRDLGVPPRVPADPSIGALATAIQVLAENIQDVSSSSDPSLGQADPSVKSGKLALALIEQSRLANNHFIENMRRSMEYDGTQVNAMLYPIYGKPGRLTRIVTNDKQEQVVQINGQPQTPGQPGARSVPAYQLTETFEADVAIKVGKSFPTLREEQSIRMGELIAQNPEMFFPLFGDLWLESTDWPEHQAMAKRAKAVLAPPIQAMLQGQQAPDPRVLAQLQQLQAAAQAQADELAKLKLEKAGNVIKGQADLAKTQLQIAAKHQDVAAQEATKLEIAGMQQKIDLILDILKVQAENARTAVDRDEERRLSAHDKAHEVALQAHQHGHERREGAASRDEAERQRAHERDMGERGHLQTLEQMAAQPQPETPA